jgi:site-specific recombinase XerD
LADLTAGPKTIAREHVEQYLADMRDRDLSPATVAKHYRSLQQLFKWLTGDGEIARSPIERMSPPSVPEQPVPILDDAALSAYLATCKGNTFENRRDTAIIRLLLDTGMRAAELCELRVEDVDFEHQVALVVGKGGRNRACPFGPKTADALRRYLRFRGHHDAAESSPFGLGKKGRMTNPGVAPDAGTAVPRRGDSGRAPAPVPAHLRPRLAGHRWAGARPGAAGGLALEGDVERATPPLPPTAGSRRGSTQSPRGSA